MRLLSFPLLTLFVSLLSIANAQPDKPFPDVPKDHWAFQAVMELKQKSILIGTPDGHFHGNRIISRHEAVYAFRRFMIAQENNDFKATYSSKVTDYFLIQFSPSTFPTTLPPGEHWYFQDIPADHWMGDEAQVLAEKGILNGYPGRWFHGQQPLTRAELSMIVVRLLRRLKHQPDVNLEQSHFDDVAGDEWWFGAQLIASGSGVMKGFADHTFRGNQPVTRNDLVVALARLVKLSQTGKTVN